MRCNYCRKEVEKCFYSKLTNENVCYECISIEGVRILLRDKIDLKVSLSEGEL